MKHQHGVRSVAVRITPQSAGRQVMYFQLRQNLPVNEFEILNDVVPFLSLPEFRKQRLWIVLRHTFHLQCQ